MELLTERLILRPQRADDLQAIYDLTVDPAMRRFLSADAPSLEDSYPRLMRSIAGWSLYGHSTFAFIERASGAYVGNGGIFRMVRSFDDGSAEADEAGWITAGPHWGKGYATEAMTAAVEWFDQAIGGRTICMIVPGNTASERLAARLGYRPTGQRLHKGDAVMLYERASRGETP